MSIGVLFSSFLLIFLAELGDKTQLVVLALAHRYRATPVIAGAFAAFALLNLLAVLFGEWLSNVVPREAILGFAGLLFLYFAYRLWRQPDTEDDEFDEKNYGWIFISTFCLIFVAELGDKTQLATIALVIQSQELWSVFWGSTAALFAVTIFAVVGGKLLRRVPNTWIRHTAALLFAVFGLLALGNAVFEAIN